MDRLQKEVHSTAVNGGTLASYQWVGASETPACAVNTSLPYILNDLECFNIITKLFRTNFEKSPAISSVAERSENIEKRIMEKTQLKKRLTWWTCASSCVTNLS